MNRSLLASRDQRALTVGATIVIGLIGGLRGFPAWRTWRTDARASAAEAMARAAHTETVLAGFAESVDTLEARTPRVLGMAPSLVLGQTPAEAAAVLAAAVADLARLSSVRLDAVETRVDTSEQRQLPLVSLDAQATGDIVGLAALLHRLESGPTLLSVRRIQIRPQNIETPADQAETLAIRFTVQGPALVRKRGEGS